MPGSSHVGGPSWLYQLISGLNLRFPTLFLVFLGLTMVDLITPDPIPFMDELLMVILTILLGLWKERRAARRERPPKIVN